EPPPWPPRPRRISARSPAGRSSTTRRPSWRRRTRSRALLVVRTPKARRPRPRAKSPRLPRRRLRPSEMRFRRAITLLLLAPAFVAVGAEAQRFPDRHGPQPVRDVPGLDEIVVDEKLDTKVPMDLAFVDHNGKQVRLRDYFDGKRPVLLSFAYHTCPTLCSMVLDATTRGISKTKWTAGVEYQVVTISIDPKDTPESAAKKRAEVLAQYGRPEGEKGWHFLVGDEKAIEAITAAV